MHDSGTAMLSGCPILPIPCQPPRLRRSLALTSRWRDGFIAHPYFWFAVRIFHPILAGATLRDRTVACGGALLGIVLTALVCRLIIPQSVHLPLLVAPMGASAVLLFAVPASPLAQPWPIIGGNVLSTIVGLLVVRLVGDPTLAAGLAVAIAIAVMSLTRCLHPPGGAAALSMVLAGTGPDAPNLLFPVLPVGVNAVILVGLGLAFHQFSRHSYPHRAPPPALTTRPTVNLAPELRTGFTSADIDAALADLRETFDISREDVDQLLRRVELRALERTHGKLTCADLMSRNVVALTEHQTADEARQLLLDHGIRVLPLLDTDGRVLGAVGLRELASKIGTLREIASAIPLVEPQRSAADLIGLLNNSVIHAVAVVDSDRHLLGIVTQTDLLAALAHNPMQGLVIDR